MTVLLLFLVVLVTFCLGHLTGDPVRLMVPDWATQADIETVRHTLGLDRPLYVQFAEYIRRALQGDLGMSLRYRTPAASLALSRLSATV